MDIGIQKNINIGLNLKSSSPSSSIAEAILLLIVCVLFFWFIILPKQSAVNQQKVQLDSLSAQEAEFKANLETLNNLVSQLNSDKQDVSRLDQAIPLNGKTIDLQLLIQSFAQSSGVSVGSINVSGNTTAPVSGDKALINNPYGVTRTLQKLNGSVVVVGTFAQLKAFLQQLEKSGRIMDISSLNIDPASQGNLNMKVVLSAYYFAP